MLVMADAPTPSEPPDAKLRLLDAAERVFADKGYDSATVREICREAGVNVASINYYFGDKERLYVESLKRAHACADDTGLGEPVFEWPPGTPPAEKLKDFIRMMASRMHAPARPTAMQLLMREFAHPSAAGREVILEFIRPKAMGLWGILRELLPAHDPPRLLMVGFSVMGQILFYRQNRPVVELIFGKEQVDALDLEMVVEHVTRFTLRALGFGGEPRV
jgi:AcrR family transcriptional regulator